MLVFKCTHSDFNPLEKLIAYLVVACPTKISAIKWKYLNGYLHNAVISDLVFNYTKVITLESTSFTLPWENAGVADAFWQWLISIPCWPGPEFIYFTQFRVYARNINDGNTLCDPSHKGSHVTIKVHGMCHRPSPSGWGGLPGPADLARVGRVELGKGVLHS